MTTKSIEERIQRLEDVRQIENLMAKYAYLHTAGRHEETARLFATKTPGVRAEIARIGRWEGTEGVYKAMVKNHQFMGVGSPGGLLFIRRPLRSSRSPVTARRPKGYGCPREWRPAKTRNQANSQPGGCGATMGWILLKRTASGNSGIFMSTLIL